MQQWIRRTITVTISETWTWTWDCDPLAEVAVAGNNQRPRRVIQVIHRKVTLPPQVVIVAIEINSSEINPSEKEK